MIVGHILFGVAATLLVDWGWIPLTPQQKESGRSLKDIKRCWGWDVKVKSQDESISRKDSVESHKK